MLTGGGWGFSSREAGVDQFARVGADVVPFNRVLLPELDRPIPTLQLKEGSDRQVAAFSIRSQDNC